MNTIKYESDDSIFVGIILWFFLLAIIIITPYVLGGIALRQNIKLSKRVSHLEQIVISNSTSTNQIQIVGQ